MKIDLHTHSIVSGHALNTVYEMIAEAKKRGITHLGITEHGPGIECANTFLHINSHLVSREFRDTTLIKKYATMIEF